MSECSLLSPSLKARIAALVTALAALGALALPAPAAADDSVVPVLTGGELHWTGTATRQYNASYTDPDTGSQTQDSGGGTINWDTRILLTGHYSDAPDSPIGDGLVWPTSYVKALGSSSSHHYEVDCESAGSCSPPITKDCTWNETTAGPGAFVEDAPTGHKYEVGSYGPGIVATNYSCRKYVTDDPTLWSSDSDCGAAPPSASAEVCATDIAFPDTPLEGDAASITKHFDHSASGIDCAGFSASDAPCTQTGHSTLTLSCALCVSGIRFQQPEVPSGDLADVGSEGTFDGNRVRITATIHNATTQSITAPVRFRDLITKRDLPVADGGQQPAAQVTFAPQADTTVTFDWDTEGFAWYSPHKPDPHQIAVMTPYGGARRDLAVHPKPVLLVHGYNSDASTWAGYDNLFTGERKDWIVRAVTGMNTDPFSGKSLAVNAQILGRAIEQLRRQYDAEHVDLVGHSMGGLISRQYLQAGQPRPPDKRSVVAHLVMLGTPNRGSNCAYVAWALGAHGWPTLQLMPSYLESIFDTQVTSTGGTKLSVLAGIAHGFVADHTTSMCSLQTPNDLVVWRQSAFWTLSDTATLDNLPHTAMTKDPTAFQFFVLPHLAVTPQGPALNLSRDHLRASRDRVASASGGEAPTAIAGLALARTVHVRARHSVTVPLQVAGGNSVSVLALAPAGVQLTLRDPAGRTVDRRISTGELTPLAGKGKGKVKGTWTIVVTNPAAATVRVGLIGRIVGDPFGVIPTLSRHGKHLVLTVAISGRGRASVTAAETSVGRRGKTFAVHLRRSGGRYTATLKPMAGGSLVTVKVRSALGTRIATAAA